MDDGRMPARIGGYTVLRRLGDSSTSSPSTSTVRVSPTLSRRTARCAPLPTVASLARQRGAIVAWANARMLGRGRADLAEHLPAGRTRGLYLFESGRCTRWRKAEAWINTPDGLAERAVAVLGGGSGQQVG